MSTHAPLSSDTSYRTHAAPSDSQRSGAPISLLHVVAPAPFGGLESVLLSLSAGQLARGHRPHVAVVLTPEEVEHPFVDALRERGVPMTVLHLGVRAYLEERRRVVAIARTVGADILHTHGYRPDVAVSGIARRLGIPRVATVHGFCAGGWKGRLYEWLQVRAYRRFDGVIAVARPQLEVLRDAGVDASRTHMLPNAWTPTTALDAAAAREALGVPPSAFHLGWVGRLSQEKGADVFLDSLAQLRDVPFVASIVGDGPMRTSLEARAAELGIADRVRWHGSLASAGRYFPAFDLFVLSSRTEGTPMVLFEAMGARVPIAATAVGGVPDVLAPDEARLVASENPPALAAAIRAIHEQPRLSAELADRAAHRLEQDFGSEAWLARHDDIYRQLIHSRSRS